MAVSMLEEKLAKSLECAICLDTFDDPRMLRCQHSYCRKCLEKIVVRVGSTYKLTCPECREDIKLPRRGVASLQSNLLINELLSLRLNTGVQSNENSPCDKHSEELLELFCEVCEEPVCKACLVIDHRDHSYSLIKDVFPRIKREVLTMMREARPKISALRAEVISIEDEETKIRDNAEEVSQEIDAFIDTLINKQTANLESERRRLKQEVSEKTSLQLSKFHDHKEALLTSLGSLEFAEQSLDPESRNKAEFIRRKAEVTSKITELRSLAEEFRPCEKVIFNLHNATPKEENVKELGKITVRGEYCLGMSGGEEGILYTGRAEQWCDFVFNVTRQGSFRSEVHRNFMDHFKVIVWNQDGEIAFPSSSLENKGNGSRGFRFRPTWSGDYKISISNEKLFGGEVHGSPFIWKVLPSLQLNSWVWWINSIGRRDYTYLSNSVLEDGQHSWRVRLLVPEGPQDNSHRFLKIGVKHPYRDSFWVWRNGYRSSPHISVPSTISINSVQRGDLFICFLDLDKGELKIYNDRTRESDTWRDVEAPVNIYLHPDSLFLSTHFAV